ncbi:potassium-transporting ATPase subunit C [Arthrobacter sp. 35W]|uniref:potassium-transporting ATPase subunit C n=1 Tax=Arthrobacter sp. 35W TaxID=1132441 RepID=UPI000420D3CA|nr:potassium-transporting ATPase subunit C [Arthrobacter sp. 35W]
MTSYLRQLLTAARFLLLATLVLGLAYPVVVFGLGQVLAPAQANGSIIREAAPGSGASGTGASDGAAGAGTAVGSSLLAQPVEGHEFFYPRPSAVAWDPASSSASNLGPNSPALAEAIDASRAEVAARENVDPAAVPIDAVTASGSGLDPDISPAYAALQAPRVAKANGLSEAQVNELIAHNTSGPLESFLSQPAVNTTTLNLALAALAK